MTNGDRNHDLRHRFALRSVALGDSLSMIGKLLRHAYVRTTARYAHLTRDWAQQSAPRFADRIAADNLQRPPELGQSALRSPVLVHFLRTPTSISDEFPFGMLPYGPCVGEPKLNQSAP